MAQIRFLTAVKDLKTHETSAATEKAVRLGQELLEELPTSSPLYSTCAFCLVHCLFVTWEKTHAERRRDRELLDIIGSRMTAAMKYCRSDDPYRPLLLSTHQKYYCMVRSFSVQLENDFWEHERIHDLNGAIRLAKLAWDELRDTSEAAYTADHLGNVYVSRFQYLGRFGDLDDALTFSTRACVLSGILVPEFQLRTFVPHAMRLSFSSTYEDQPDEFDDAIDYMAYITEGRRWNVENRGVTAESGSSYAVALRFFSQIYRFASIRRDARPASVSQYLDKAVNLVQEVGSGIMEIDPGRQLCFIDSASAYLHHFLTTSSRDSLDRAVQSAVSALELCFAGASTTPQITLNRGSTISNLAMTDDRSSPAVKAPLNERRNQRHAVEALEISADILLAHYQVYRHPADLTSAIVALKLSAQGIHGWSPQRPKMLFKLNQALHEQLKQFLAHHGVRIRNFNHRSKTKGLTNNAIASFQRNVGFQSPLGAEPFAPLMRCQDSVSVHGFQPLYKSSWGPIAARGAYDHDMKLSTDAEAFLASEIPVSAEHIKRQYFELDTLIDHFFEKLPTEDEETNNVRTMWKRIYCTSGTSVKRAEMYQRALNIFIKHGDLPTACKFSDLAGLHFGHLELYLLEADIYTSEMSYISTLASTIACVWMTHSRDSHAVIRLLELGRELGSQYYQSKIRSYGYDAGQELLPKICGIRDQLLSPADRGSGPNRHEFKGLKDESSDIFRISKDFTALRKEILRSEAELQPFGRVHCHRQAHDGFVIHLVTAPGFAAFALITSPEGFQHLSLPLCRYKQLVARVTSLREAVKLCEDQQSRKGTANEKLRLILAWLWKAIARPITRFLNLSPSPDHDSWSLPHIRWIACGIFSQLPIHAAGSYAQKPPVYMDQYAVSSYLSSLHGGAASQQRKPWLPHYQNAAREFTLFGMSTSPAVPEGPLADLSVDAEKARIFASLGPTFTNNALVDCNLGAARNMMRWARLVHFTCHGVPHPTDPLRSRLVLLRDDREPCTVAAVRAMDIPNALLLFLSACHSALDPRAAHDDVTHLAKAFLLAGFPTVIGTLWQAYEASALDVAEAFYARVAERWGVDADEPEPGLFPRALHAAVSRWRDRGSNLWKAVDWASWVCFTG